MVRVVNSRLSLTMARTQSAHHWTEHVAVSPYLPGTKKCRNLKIHEKFTCRLCISAGLCDFMHNSFPSVVSSRRYTAAVLYTSLPPTWPPCTTEHRTTSPSSQSLVRKAGPFGLPVITELLMRALFGVSCLGIDLVWCVFRFLRVDSSFSDFFLWLLFNRGIMPHTRTIQSPPCIVLCICIYYI